jgi:hypothetical protein
MKCNKKGEGRRGVGWQGGRRLWWALIVSILIPGACLLLCLILFLMQVKLYSKDLEPQLLFVFHIHWWLSVCYLIAGE